MRSRSGAGMGSATFAGRCVSTVAARWRVLSRIVASVLDLPLECLLVLELCDVETAATFSTFVLPAVLFASATTALAVCVVKSNFA